MHRKRRFGAELGVILRRFRSTSILQNPAIFTLAVKAAGSALSGLTGMVVGNTVLTRLPVPSATDVFTLAKNMQYRAKGTAPLGVIVPIQGKADGTAGDTLTYPRGAQVSGNWYGNANSNQGSVAVLFEVPWAGNDGKLHAIVNTPTLQIYKSAGSQIVVGFQGDAATIFTTGATVAGWALGSQHFAVVRWDNDNVVSGSAYLDLWVDGVQITGKTSAMTVNVAPSAASIGSFNNLTYPIGGPGIKYVLQSHNVFSDAMVAALWNSGTPVSPDRVASNPELFAMAWLPGARAASGNFAGTLAAEGASMDWSAYNSSTNPNGNLVVNPGFESALGSEWSAGPSCTITRKTDATGLAGFFDTAYVEVANAGSTNRWAFQTISGRTAGDSIHLVGYAANIDATSATIDLYSGTLGDEMNTLLATQSVTATSATKISFAASVATGHDRITILLKVTGADTKKARFDNIGVWVNKCVNGGMEGVYTKTGTAITTSTAATSTVTDLGGGSYRVVDGTAWNLSLAVVGMIAEWHDGSGFLTTVTDASDLVEFNGVTGNPPTTGDAVAVYSAIAPGWSRAGSGAAPRLFRSSSPASGSYSQGVAFSDGNNRSGQDVAVLASTWYLVSTKIRAVSGTAAVVLSSGFGSTSLTVGTTFTPITMLVRSTGTGSASIACWCPSPFLVDDFSYIPLDPVDFTATPATDANSSEADGYRLDGGDVTSIPNNGLVNAGAGTIMLRVKPRGWAGADSQDHFFLSSNGAGANHFSLAKRAANNIQFSLTDAAGNTLIKLGNVTNVSLPDETFAVVTIRWSATGQFVALNGVDLATSSGSGVGYFGTAPTGLLFGSNYASASQADITLSHALFFNRAITDAEEASNRVLLNSLG